MAEFPLDPHLSKTLIAAKVFIIIICNSFFFFLSNNLNCAQKEFGCTEEILTIVAMMSVEAVFYMPRDKMYVLSNMAYKIRGGVKSVPIEKERKENSSNKRMVR